MTIKDNNLEPIELVQGYPEELVDTIHSVAQWGMDRNITAEGGATAISQVTKMFEETQEFVDADTYEERVDAIGDMFVVLIQMARLAGISLDTALSHAYEQIRHRKGTMQNGVFVKE